MRTEHGPWPHPERELIAGVNSWGIGGTNCHIVLSEAPAAQEAPAPATDGMPRVWPVSARTETALRAQADRLHTHLTDTDPEAGPDQVGHALAFTRTAFRRRAAAVGTTRAELLDGLRALAAGTASPHLVTTGAPATGPAPSPCSSAAEAASAPAWAPSCTRSTRCTPPPSTPSATNSTAISRARSAR
ncbi:hypothetical protein GCM10020295_15290 [Streptomyces cinereospinus]